MKSTYTILEGENSQLYFNLKAGNGEIILQSEGYKQVEGALNGVKSVQINSQNLDNYERRRSKREEPYFVLKAANGEIIGVSEMYSSTSAMEIGIKSVLNNGSTDEIDREDKPKDHEIIVNGRKKIWSKKQISFIEVIELAFGKYEDRPTMCYTVTYSRGVGNKPEGSMVKGDVVKVKSKMIFNVTATDKS